MELMRGHEAEDEEVDAAAGQEETADEHDSAQVSLGEAWTRAISSGFQVVHAAAVDEDGEWAAVVREDEEVQWERIAA